MHQSSTREGSDGAASDRVRAQLTRILGSRTFANAPSLRRLLEHLVEQSLEGKASQVKEYSLGVEVFGRGPSFDPRVDTIVRVQARRLRAKLAEYYATEGRDDTLVIEQPKGRYEVVITARAAAGVDAAEPDRAEAPQPRRWPPRWWWSAGASAVIIAGILGAGALRRSPPASQPRTPRSVAVLPFKPLHPSAGDEQLQSAMTEAVISKLSRLARLRVAPFARVRRYGHPDQDPIAAGRELETDAVLEGYFQRDGDRIQVRSRLLRTVDGTTLATNEWQEAFTDILLLQNRLAESVTDALAMILSDDERLRVRFSSTSSPRAYEHYMFGQHHLDVRAGPRMLAAEREFREAIRFDDRYAPAYAGLSLSLSSMAWLGSRRGVDVMGPAKEAALKALALDDSLALAHSALAWTYDIFDYDSPAAQREHLRAFELDRHEPWVLRGFIWFLLARDGVDDASELNRLDLSMDLASPLANRIKAQIYFFARRYDDCIAHGERTLSLDLRNFTLYGWLARCYEAQQRFAAAVNAREMMGGDIEHVARGSRRRHQMFSQHGWRGYLSQQLADLGPDARAYNRAEVMVRLGRYDDALRELERAFDERDPWVTVTITPQWDPLKTLPRFQALRQRTNVSDDVLQALKTSRSTLSRRASDAAIH